MSETSDSSLLLLDESSCVFERDSVVIIDGLKPLKSTQFAGTNDGRFTFILGNQRISSVGTRHADDDIGDNLGWNECATFDLDIIDLFLTRKTRIRGIGDLYAFGTRRGIYAINERTLVINEYHEIDQVLRQRLVQIDPEAETAECLVYRTYEARFHTFDLSSCFGQNIVVTVSIDDYRGYIYPADPLSSVVHRDISAIIAQARAHVQLANRGRSRDSQLKISRRPFVVTDAALGMFVYRRQESGVSGKFKQVIILDLSDNCVYMQEVTMPSNFPYWIDELHEGGKQLQMRNEREITLAVATDEFTYIVGIMNVRTLEWANVKNCPPLAEEAYLVPSRAGDHIVICEMVDRVGRSREIIGPIDVLVVYIDDEMERFRLLRHPLRVSSLRRLATIALQKSGQLEMLQLKQIADRIID